MVKFKDFVKNKDSFVFSMLAAWAVLVFFVKKSFNSVNYIYAIGEMNTFDSQLFNNNVFLGEGVISPRYIADYIFSFIMQINGGSWAEAAIVWIYIGAAVQAIAIANIVTRLTVKNSMLYALLFSLMLGYNKNELATFGLVFPQSISIGIALGFSILAISFLFGKVNYNLAWIFAGITSIFHIHEGIYCCVIIFIFLLTDCLNQRKLLVRENIMILLTMLCLIVIIGPGLFTDTMDITNEEFVHIYSIVRHPHHLVPSAWGINAIIKSGLINICILGLCLEVFCFFNHDRIRLFYSQALLLIVVWISVICFSYVFTEVFPIAFVSTMFLPKFFKYVVLISLIWALKAVYIIRNSEVCVLSYFLLFFIFASSWFPTICIIGFYLFMTIAIICAYSLKIRLDFLERRKHIFDFILVVLMLFLAHKSARMNLNFGQIGMIILVLLISFANTFFKYYNSQLNRKIWWTSSCAFVLLICSIYGKVFWFENGQLKLINERTALINTMGSDLYELANVFKKKTDPSEEFIAYSCPEVASGWLQVVSERNCYVVEGVIPSCKSKVDDWYYRYMKMEELKKKNIEDIILTMADSDISYILVDHTNYKKFDNSDFFSLFAMCREDSYRVYKIN